ANRARPGINANRWRCWRDDQQIRFESRLNFVLKVSQFGRIRVDDPGPQWTLIGVSARHFQQPINRLLARTNGFDWNDDPILQAKYRLDAQRRPDQALRRADTSTTMQKFQRVEREQEL